MTEKQNSIKFDLPSLLEDIAQMGPDGVNVDHFIALTEKKGEKEDERKVYLLIKGDDVIATSHFLFRSMREDPKLALIVTLAATMHLVNSKG